MLAAALSTAVSANSQNELTHSLYINELVQSTFGGDLDMLYEYPDGWVEIYNPGSKEVSLAGYRIGKKSFKKSYELPDLKVPAKGHVVIFCDKEENNVVREIKDFWGNVVRTELAEVHTDFRLPTDEEGGVYLYAPDKQMVDSVHVPVLVSVNVGYGRLSDGDDTWGYEMKVTKGTSNSGGHAIAVLPDPVLSPSSFLGNDSYTLVNVKTSKITRLKMSNGANVPAEAVVRYTLDGTEPCDTSDILSTYGVYLSKNTIVKAAIFLDGYLTPKAVAGSYMFHGRRISLPAISIVTDSLDLYDKEYGIFTRNLGANNPKYDWRRPATMSFFSSAGLAAKFSQRCELRVGGAYSRNNRLKSVIVYADKRFNTNDWFEQYFWPTTTPSVKRVPSLALRSSGNDFGNSHMRDGIAQIMMGMYTDLDWQGFQPAIYYINGRYQGIINIRERANEDNVWSHYNEMTDITVIENRVLKKGDWQLYQDFEDFFNEDGHTLAEYDSIMDVVEFTNLMIDNIFMSNTDFPGNNNVLWRPNAEGGRWRWIIKDVDRAFGIWGHSSSEEFLKWCLNINPNNINGESANGEKYTRLFRALMDIPEYRDLFLDRFTVYMGDFLTPTMMNYWIDWGQKTMDEEYDYFSKAQGVSGKSSWINTLNDMKSWGARRWDDMFIQLHDFFGLGSQVNVTLNKQKSNANLEKITVNDVPLTAGKFDGRLYAGRKYVMTGICKDNVNGVIAWNIRMTDSKGTVSTKNVIDEVLELTIPEGTKSVEITSVIGKLGVTSVDAGPDEIKSAVYYNAQGMQSATPFEGLNIIKYTLGDGRTVTVKKMMGDN